MAVTRPLAKGILFAQEVAEGNLGARLDVDQKDELGVLADNLRDMVAKVGSVVGDVRAASENVAAGSEQLSASAGSLSQGATEAGFLGGGDIFQRGGDGRKHQTERGKRAADREAGRHCVHGRRAGRQLPWPRP